MIKWLKKIFRREITFGPVIVVKVMDAENHLEIFDYLTTSAPRVGEAIIQYEDEIIRSSWRVQEIAHCVSSILGDKFVKHVVSASCLPVKIDNTSYASSAD
jgi:hypothetical protein